MKLKLELYQYIHQGSLVTELTTFDSETKTLA